MKTFLSLLFCLSLVANCVLAIDTYTVSVSSVSDGDTFSCTVSEGSARGTKLRVRLAGIDAPEVAHGSKLPGQPLGNESRMLLQQLLARTPVFLEVLDRDTRYNRLVCNVLYSSQNGRRSANVEIVRQGLAEVYVEYLKNIAPALRADLLSAEAQAKTRRMGIWSLATYERPAQYRRRTK